MKKEIFPLQELTLHPIGVIHTPYQEKYHAPRQPGVDKKEIIGTIELYPDKNFDQALEYLAGFERVWIISWFHKNNDWKPKVLPPRSGRTKRGVFATRSPHRPNPIGLSLCKLIDVKGRIIRVENPDLLDGTPILDIKPYIPYAEAFPDSEIGWLAEIENMDETPYNIEVSNSANEQAAWLQNEYDIHLIDRAIDILSFDPLPHSYRRIMSDENGGFVMAIKSWRLRYTITGKNVLIFAIESGYPKEVIDSIDFTKEPLHDQEAHIQFHGRWMKDMA
ncbi:MAG: tRNA (N6-threonylcarbamoyladenosine(37)-N6)-methyltransferase TrmO [Bacteroidota bacterium]|nr:tRNA (N6-threonylcarbamoyladenosine(37)-N6)-methyltransferase TrmO [Bacteroidota bacterium]